MPSASSAIRSVSRIRVRPAGDLQRATKRFRLSDLGVIRTQASEDRMPEEGAYKIKLEIANRLVNLNVIVVSRLSDDIILGMNSISDFGLACDPLTLTFSYNKCLAKRALWSRADVYPVRACKITPGDSRFIKCRAKKATGEEVTRQQEIVVDIAGVSSLVKTNKCGVFMALIPNLSPMRTLELQRDRRVDEAFHRDDFIAAGVDQKGIEILKCVGSFTDMLTRSQPPWSVTSQQAKQQRWHR